MKNLRKAKPGDITCLECDHSRPPDFPGLRYRCTIGSYYAVARKDTCDRAERARTDTEHAAGGEG